MSAEPVGSAGEPQPIPGRGHMSDSSTVIAVIGILIAVAIALNVSKKKK